MLLRIVGGLCKEDQAMEQAETCSKCFAEKQDVWHITYHIWTESCPLKVSQYGIQMQLPTSSFMCILLQCAGGFVFASVSFGRNIQEWIHVEVRNEKTAPLWPSSSILLRVSAFSSLVHDPSLGKVILHSDPRAGTGMRRWTDWHKKSASQNASSEKPTQNFNKSWIGMYHL